MKIRLTIASLLGLLMLAPAIVSAANITSSLNVAGSFITGTDSQLTVSLSNFQVISGAVGVLSISDSAVADVKSAYVQDKSGWVKLTPAQSGTDVTAKFTSDTGFDQGGARVMTFRVNFKSPRTYIIGFSLQTADGKTLTSSAVPMVVSGPKVLGESITAPSSSGRFARTMSYSTRGSDVSALQNKLAAEGFFSTTPSFFFGRATQAAVKAYQAAHGISPANGVVGPQTLAALNQ